MTWEERLAALAPLGLTPRQTRFLALVLLHSGYCVRRQYLAYAGVRYGKNVREFLDGLVHRRLALRLVFRADRGHVYHLYARAVYRAVGQEENRNRRVASPALIARRLMLLDFALGEPDVEWAATEDDKVSLFTTRFRVPVASLPQHRFDAAAQDGQPTLRYFLHKLPIFVASNADVPHFVYLAADGSLPAFERFLRDHRLLFAQLPQWVVVSAAQRRAGGRRLSGDLRSVPHGDAWQAPGRPPRSIFHIAAHRGDRSSGGPDGRRSARLSRRPEAVHRAGRGTGVCRVAWHRSG